MFIVGKIAPAPALPQANCAWTNRPAPRIVGETAMRIAVYPGSFDPVTNGHLDVVARAARLFDEVIVAVARNEAKTSLFSEAERVALIEASLPDHGVIRVTHFSGLLVDYARECGACAVVRGLRAISDFEFEFQMALMNRKLEPAIETIFLMPREDYSYLSSRMVKEVARLHGDIRSFVPEASREALEQRFASTAAPPPPPPPPTP